MSSHSVHYRTHRVFADSEMDLASVAIETRERNCAVDLYTAVSSEVGTSTHKTRYDGNKCIQDLLAGAAGRNRFARFPNRQ